MLETMRPNIIDQVKTLPLHSLSLIGISSHDLSIANEKGFIYPNTKHKQTYIASGLYTKPDFTTAVIQTSGYAFNRARIDSSLPLIAVVAATNNRVEIDRVVNVLNIEALGTTETTRQIQELIEDNFGRIQMMIKRFAEPQQPQKV